MPQHRCLIAFTEEPKLLPCLLITKHHCILFKFFVLHLDIIFFCLAVLSTFLYNTTLNTANVFTWSFLYFYYNILCPHFALLIMAYYILADMYIFEHVHMYKVYALLSVSSLPVLWDFVANFGNHFFSLLASTRSLILLYTRIYICI